MKKSQALRLSTSLFWVAAVCPAFAQTGESDTAAASRDGDIVVTAARREQSLQDVPLAVAAFGQEQLTRQNVRTVDDLVRVTPGVSFTRSGYFNNRADPPVIRGIQSNAGGEVTGMYVDDTPINSIRSANISTPPFPRIFDLERVEVLKGPQGTLFGGGAMGGAIRFITPQPSMNSTTLRATGEVSVNAAGGDSYEVGGALGTPIVQDKLGLRLSAFFRRDGGYVDHVDAITGATREENANWARTLVVNAALRWEPVDDLAITASLLYQNEYTNGVSQFWRDSSDISAGKFVHKAAVSSPSKDRWFLPSLKIEYDMGFATVISNTSFLSRKADSIQDYTQEINAILLSPLYPAQLFAGEEMPAVYRDRQKNFTQEIRLQSNAGSPLQWVVGAFYSRIKQRDYQLATGGDSLEQLTQTYFGASVQDVFGLAPIDVFGETGVSYAVVDSPIRTQKALFAQGEYEILDGLKATAGIRYSETKSSFDAFTGGPFNAGNTTNVGTSKEHSWTPKFGLSYQPDKNNLFYVNMAKGFRPGGAQPPVPYAFCGQDLAALGYSSSPTSFKSDSLWSYEVGTKNDLFGGALRIDASAYYIKWKDIQRSVGLPICTLGFIANLGEVESKGFELGISARPTRDLSLNLGIGYNNAENLDTIQTSTGSYLTKAGQSLGNRQWTITGGIQQDFTIGDNPAYIGINVEYLGGGSEDFDPQVQGYVALTAIRPKDYTVVKLRGSITFNGIEVSPFVDNVFNVHPTLTYGNYSTNSPLIYSTTIAPRTIGVRLTVRK